jgi:pSer/pThr/pTyr-binding forkhead associated (FHA) protein
LEKKVQAPSGSERQLVEQDFSNGYISVIANFFGDKQEFGLQLGDNVIGRRNRDTDGVDIAIINTDPSMGRKHCVINVKKNAAGKLIYTLRDFPSLTGTFLNNVCLGKKEQVVLNHGAVITLGATTFILHYPEGQEEEEMMY